MERSNVDDSAAFSMLNFTRADIEQTIPARFAEVVRCFPNSIALSGNGRQWTYSDLSHWTAQIANAIRAHTPAASGCVAFLVEQSPEMVAATLGVVKSGNAYLGVHPQLPAAAQRDVLADATPRLLLTTAKLLSRANEISRGLCPIQVLDDIDGRFPDSDIALQTRPEDASTIFYTSGTTGQPKGVFKSHRAVLHRVWLSTQHDRIVPSDRQSLLTHASFSASEADIFAALLQGARVCVFDVATEGFPCLRRWIDQEKITLLHPPVLLFRRFLSTLEGANLFPSVRLVALAGDVVLPSDVQKWKKYFSGECTLLHRFSTAETALLTVAHIRRDREPEGDFVSAGKPVSDKFLALVDETGQPVAAGQAGELVVRSRYLSSGYWRRPRETAAAFQTNPTAPDETIYRTGDRGKFLSDGSLVFLGRREHLAKIRGYRVDAREVESALVQIEGVSLAAVVVDKVVIDKQDDQDRLSAFVVMREGAGFNAREIREALQARLPQWKIPASVTPLAEIPMTLSGKVDRQKLRNLQPAAPEAVTFASNVEEELADIWRVALRCEALGPDDHFLDLGGDSIAAITTLNRVERLYGLRLSVADFYQKGTIRQLAATVGASSTTAAPAATVTPRNVSDDGWSTASTAPAPPATTVTPRNVSDDGWSTASTAPDPSATTVTPRSVSDDSPSTASTAPGPRATTVTPRNVSDAYLDLLAQHAAEFVFINPGTDTAPILESVARRDAHGRGAPRFVLCLHESVGMAAAHGYFMVTGRPQVLMVHVDVGTQNIGANLHNAQRGRAGVVICAGRSPYTMDGHESGGRNRYNHWIQEQFHQAGIVQGYVKWHYELTRARNLPMAVGRAFQIASAEPPGPVYLTLPREILMEPMPVASTASKGYPPPKPQAPDAAALSQAAEWLLEAKTPLILVSYAGRNPQAVSALVRFAELLAIPVVESRYRLNFPSSHPLHHGYSALRALPQADCVLILDHDVPWVPAQGSPHPEARIIHVDNDPLKRDIPLWGFGVDLSIQADSTVALHALTEHMEQRIQPLDRARIEQRRHRVVAEHESQTDTRRRRARGLASIRPIAPEWAAECLNGILSSDTIVISEAVTNGPVLWDHLQMDTPGSYFQSLGSGLGWALGAAIGAKLASPSKTVICVVGDGSWVFGNPVAAYWTALEQRSPFLTVIFNNQQYYATVEAIAASAPQGEARQSGNYPACQLPRVPLYSKIAAAMGLWATTVEDPADLPAALQEALDAVRHGQPAVVDVLVSTRQPGPFQP